MRTTTFQDISDCTEFRRLTHTPVPKLLHGTLLILCLLIAAAGTWLAMTEANLVVESQGRVRPIGGADQNWEELTTQIASETGGVVDQVNVDAGDRVRKGDVLLQFNTEQLESQESQLNQKLATTTEELEQLSQYQSLFEQKSRQDRAQAEAELERGAAEIEKAKQLRESKIRTAKARLTDAQDQFKQFSALYKANAVSKREYRDAEMKRAEAAEALTQASLPVATEKIEVLKSALEAVKRDAEAKMKEIEIQISNNRGELESTRIELADLERRVQRSSVVATMDGVVTEVSVKAGDVLQSGKVGISTVEQDGLALVINVTSNDVGHLQPGMLARVKLDAFDFRDYGVVKGTVKFISPDSQLVENPGGQQVAAYQVTIELAADKVSRGQLRGEIKLGMTGKSEIITEQKSLLSLVFSKIRGTISLT